MRVALVNTNRIRPPVAPIGLDYVAEALNAAGHTVGVLDLCWEEDLNQALVDFFKGSEYGLVGLTLRNTDDCAFSSRQSFVAEFRDIVRAIRKHTNAALIAGGVGFSVMPEKILAVCDLDAGVWGDGEPALVGLAQKMGAKRPWQRVPGNPI